MVSMLANCIVKQNGKLVQDAVFRFSHNRSVWVIQYFYFPLCHKVTYYLVIFFIRIYQNE